MKTLSNQRSNQRIVPRTLLALALGAGALASSSAALQSAAPPGSASDQRIRSEIDYARGLAEDYQFVDLAEQVIESIERSGAASGMGEQLDLAKCDIYAAGAKRESDPARRLDLFRKAVDAYTGYIEKNPLAKNLADAQRAYADVANTYARALELELEDAVGEEADAIREEIVGTLTTAARTVADIMQTMPAETLEEQNRKFGMQLIRGQMLVALAKASTNGAFFFTQAEQELEDLALSAGEKSWFGLRGFLELGSAKVAQEQYGEAVVFYEFVLDTLMPRGVAWVQSKEQLSKAELDQMFLLASLALPGALDAYVRADDKPGACNLGLHFHNLQKQEGFLLNRPLGYLALLAVARTLLDAGGHVGGSQSDLAWFATVEEMEAAGHVLARNQRQAHDVALSIAQTVNRDNKRNTLQIRAQQLISDVTNRPGVRVAPAVLFEAAQGEYYAQNFPQAIDGLKRMLSELDQADDATRTEFGGKVMYFLGMSYRRQDRAVEACMAFKEGAQNWQGDPEFHPKNVQAWYAAANELKNGAPQDQLLEAQWKRAEDLLTQTVTEDTEEILFRQALRLWDQEDFAAARAKFQEIPPNKPISEKAMVYAAVCLEKLEQPEPAKEELERYLEEYVTDPMHTVSTERHRAYRLEARAMATYYLGKIAREQQDSDRVLELYADYHEQFPGQTSYGPAALYAATLAYLEKGDVEAAKRTVATLVETFPTAKATGAAAMAIYLVLQEELAKATDDASKRSITRQMAELLSLSNDLASAPDFVRLREESKLWMDVEAWEQAKETLELIVTKFGGEQERADDLYKFVNPDLGHVLLELEDVRGAYAVLAPLMPPIDETNPPRRPTSSTVEDFCRALGGWVDGGPNEIVEHPGVGGAENLDLATKWWAKVVLASDTWTCEWYDLKFHQAYLYYQWSLIDSNKRTVVKDLIASLQTNLGETFEGGPATAGMAEACGGDATVQRRFIWLSRKLL